MTLLDYRDMNREAALRFLQTAVVVDDAATVAPGDESPGTLRAPGLSAVVRAASGIEESAEHDVAPPPNLSVDVKRIADALADREVTCGVLRPSKDEGDEKIIERVANVSARVDLVVLDWILDQATDLSSLDAIRRIVERDRRGCRVIAIYTSQENLDLIAEEVVEHIPDVERLDSTPPMLGIGGTRIALFHKADVDPPSGDSEYPALDEDELAARLIDVFLDVVEGWVRSAALHTMAAIRENVHVVLDRLGKSLDVGYAGHLFRIDHIDDGPGQLFDAIGGELRGVIEDDRQSREVAGRDALGAWVAQRDAEDELAVDISLIANYLDASERDDKTNALNNLRSNVKENSDLPNLNGQEFKLAQSALFTGGFNVATAREADGAFAMLLAVRRPYGEKSPSLRLGTIVCDPDGKKFWLCMQPVCDSVRLDDTIHSFPMIPLRVLSPHEANRRFDFVVPWLGSIVHLFNPAKPAKILPFRFRADPKTRTVRFKPTRFDQDVLSVRNTSNSVFHLVAQLKPSHGARVAHAMGQEMSRIGLDESEWLLEASKLDAPEN